MYVIDMGKNTQVRKKTKGSSEAEDEDDKAKLIKRDNANAFCKGVAGLAYK